MQRCPKTGLQRTYEGPTLRVGLSAYEDRKYSGAVRPGCSTYEGPTLRVGLSAHEDRKCIGTVRSPCST